MDVQDELIPTRQSLLERLKNAADDESWRTFFETYWRLIYFTGIKAGLTEVEAQDLVQETVISVFKSMEGFQYAKKNGSFKSWLLRLTHWRILDQLRRRQKDVADLGREPGPQTGTEALERLPEPLARELEAAWNHEWTKSLMQAAVENVRARANPKHWQIFELYSFQEWPIPRITAALGVSSATVYIVNHRLKKALRKEFNELECPPNM